VFSPAIINVRFLKIKTNDELIICSRELNYFKKFNSIQLLPALKYNSDFI